MSVGSLLQRKLAVNAHRQAPGGEPGEEVARAPCQFLGGGDVVPQGRPSEKERAFGAEGQRAKLRHGAAGVAEADQHAAWTQAVEAALKGAGAHRVIDHVGAAPARQRPHTRGEWLAHIKDNLSGASVPRQSRLRLGANEADDLRPAGAGDLHQQQAHAACRRRDHTGVPRFQREGAVGQVVRRHPLKQQRRRQFQRDPVGHTHKLVGGGEGQFGVATNPGGGGDPVAHGPAADPRAKRLDGTGKLCTGDEGQIEPIEPRALIRLDVVQPNRRDPDLHLAGAWRRRRNFFEAQSLGAAGRVNPHGTHLPLPLLRRVVAKSPAGALKCPALRYEARFSGLCRY